jgi:hypothetical protein
MPIEYKLEEGRRFIVSQATEELTLDCLMSLVKEL